MASSKEYMSTYNKLYRAKNRAELAEKDRKRNALRKEYMKAYMTGYYEENKSDWQENYSSNREVILSQKRVDRQNRPEVYKAKESRWSKNNPDKVNAKIARRKAAQINATPSWLTAEQIQQIRVFYTLALEKTRETGIKHSVDHIVPLRGQQVNGLHVPWNLQVMESKENSRKGNKI